VDAATNRVVTDLAEHLATKAGHEVEVLCGGAGRRAPFHPPEEDATEHNQVRIHRIGDLHWPRWRITGWNHPVNVLRYIILATLRVLWRRKHYDFVVTLDYPMLIRIGPHLAQLLTRQRPRHVCWILDMTTEWRFLLGEWSHSDALHRFIHFLNTFPEKHAHLNVVPGRCMAERLLRRGVPAARIRHIPIWHYGDLIRPMPLGNSHPALEGLRGKWIVLYSGFAGKLHGFEAIKAAMVELRDHPRIHFVFAGDYPIIKDIESWAPARELPNFTRIDQVPFSELNLLLAGADSHLVTLRNETWGVCVPSKLYGCMASGRPVIFVGSSRSQCARDIERAGAGYVVSDSEPARLAHVLQHLADHPSEAVAMGRNARLYFEHHNDVPVCLAKWEDIFKAPRRSLSTPADNCSPDLP